MARKCNVNSKFTMLLMHPADCLTDSTTCLALLRQLCGVVT